MAHATRRTVPGALRIVQRNALVYRRVWRGSLFFSFLQPTLFLAAMGLGVGRLVDAGARAASPGVAAAGASLPGGGSFLTFLAPGLLAAACMQTAAFESTFPVMGKMTWRRNYEAMTAAPLGVADLVLGELAWVGLRLGMVALAFAGVIAAFGVSHSPRLLAAVPAAVLTGLAFSAPLMAYAVTLRNGANFNAVYRFLITPLFLFSGVFFPVASLPGPLPWLASLTPLYHGVELVRGLVLGTLTAGAGVVHVAYLGGLCAIGALVAVRTFGWKLHA